MRYQQVLTKIISKRITGVISTEASEYPQNRLFISFEDNTYLELYGADIKVASGLDEGSVYDALRYAEKQMNVTVNGSKLVSVVRSIAPAEDPIPLT